MKSGRECTDSTPLPCLHIGSFDFIWQVHNILFLYETYYTGTRQISPKAINNLLILELWLINSLSFPNSRNQQLQDLGTFVFEVKIPKQSFCFCTGGNRKVWSAVPNWGEIFRLPNIRPWSCLFSKLHRRVENLCSGRRGTLALISSRNSIKIVRMLVKCQ